MPIPKTVIFDLGKVLLDFDYGIAIRRLLPRCRVTLEQLRQMLTGDRLLVDYEAGLVTTGEFFSRLQAAIGYEGTLDEFRRGFGDIFTPIEPMVALHAELRRGGVPTYVLSNTNELAVDFVRAQYPWFREFDGLVLSYEHRAMKPAAALYEVAERLSGLTGPDLFYLDDRAENVEAGFARGWQGVVHSDPSVSRAALLATGLLNGATGP
jgi:HAD superfamily hydrolase (TIGR01509 family)